MQMCRLFRVIPGQRLCKDEKFFVEGREGGETFACLKVFKVLKAFKGTVTVCIQIPLLTSRVSRSHSIQDRSSHKKGFTLHSVS